MSTEATSIAPSPDDRESPDGREAPDGREIVVRTHDLSRRFGRRWAYARMSLSVPRGQRLLVIGANGSGKTTLLRTLATVLKPSAGTLELFGLDPAEHPDPVRRRLALLSHASGLYEDLSARDNLRVLSWIVGKQLGKGGRGPASPEALLERVGLELRPDPVGTFSAGMRKRLQFAALLLQQPDLVLLDEPFAALDPSGMDTVTDLVRQIGGTVIIASHQVQRASALCDWCLLMDKGMPRWQGPAHQAWQAWCTVHGESAAPQQGGRAPS